MTATQVFKLFLKTQCTKGEYLFFKDIIMFDNGNKYFRTRRLYTNTFVEDYLSNNGRALNNFMTRLFILAPNLIDRCIDNPIYAKLKNDWVNTHKIPWSFWRCYGVFVNHYRSSWNKFLKEYIDESNKKINSPFKSGETYDFKLKKNIWEK